MRSEGSAFLDHAGEVVAADEAFRSCLGLDAGDATAALRARAEHEPAVRALLAGDGPGEIRVEVEGRPVSLRRAACDAGTFLHASSFPGLVAPVLEHAAHSAALARIASGIAHDVKNPLNALVLHIALLGDKVAAGGEELASGCAGNLSRMKDQIGRVNEIVRRLADVSDPVAGTGFDAGALASDVASLFGHEARRRRVTLACEAVAGTLQARGDPGRAARALLALVWRAVTRAGEGARVTVEALHERDEAVLAVEHPSAVVACEWVPEVARSAAQDLGGRLVVQRGPGTERLELRLRRETAA